MRSYLRPARRLGAVLTVVLATATVASTTGTASATPVVATTAPTVAVAAAAAPVVHDGLTKATAAASCWEAKQVVPTATDGTYWLLTPQLQAPEQFYCDMTTDGGGWVLVGRGRDGWLEGGDGQGTAAQVRTTVDGTGAFRPKQLSDATIDDLMGGTRLDSLADGVRIRRAADSAGTTWQEWRIRLASRDRWSWAFAAGLPVSSVSLNGTTYSARRSTRDIDLDGRNSTARLWTYGWSGNGYVRGFTYGTNVRGQSSPTSYLYNPVDNAASAVPFAQVWIRPRLMTSDLSFPAVPDSGTTAQTNVAVAKSGALPGAWGVTGQANGNTGELATEVSAFAQIGNTMYVGGNFKYVQKGAAATGADQVQQSYLAAFNATKPHIPQNRTLVSGRRFLLADPDPKC